MRFIYKISLIIAFFIASGSLALASFNYDSANNHFFIDSVFKIQGDSILIGSSLDEVPNAFAISNNLIFLHTEGEFNSGYRKINKRALSTPQITINNPEEDFIISSIGGNQGLNFMANAVKINQDLYSLNGVNLSNIDIVKNTIAVNKILASNLSALTSAELLIPRDSIFLAEGMPIKAIAEKIIFDNKDFCVTKVWAAYDNVAMRGYYDGTPLVFDQSVSDSGEFTCSDSTLNNMLSKRACCPEGYHVFDFNANTGKMVCCRSARGSLEIGTVSK